METYKSVVGTTGDDLRFVFVFRL
ncbi:hypothetical protein Bhyg_12875 [Pseudolycoriella hygida]|uniref:Uncharacterized protein n=1 Tax=Pseudolycoriella hygida TaxID=35572 RepID=A0A9Q0S1A2_9DIPT|nr:hypothetical protein Bhyg_12875 [Pseudolycoriella hygida]